MPVDTFKRLQRTIQSIYVNQFLTIDSGINTSIAHWMRNKKNNNKYDLYDVYEIKPHAKTKDPINKITTIIHEFNGIIKALQSEIDLIVIEGVSFWSGSLKSEVSAKTGSLALLSYIVGALIGVGVDNFIRTKIILFQNWGGQLQPHMINQRVKRNLGSIRKSQHSNDAIGMGLSLLGRFGR